MAARRRVVVDLLLWLVALFLAWIFVRQGMAKFSDQSGWAQAFRMWHFPVWFRVGVGVAEVLAALLLLTRRTASGGAIIIIAIMIGAMGTHIRWHRPGQVTSEVLPLALAIIIAFGRYKHFLLRRTPAPAP